MKPGRQPRLTAVKNAEGNPGHRPKARLGKEPKPASVPVPPEHLTAQQMQFFRQFVARIPAGVTVGIGDSEPIARYAVYQALSIEAQQDIALHGAMIQGERGSVRNKAFITLKEASAEMRRIEDAFGMSPVARTRLAGIPDDSDSDDITYFLQGHPNFLSDDD